MSEQTLAHPSIVDWLLEKDNPSVRYITLREILDFPQDDPQVLQARSDIMQSGPVPKILSRQKPEGYWGKPEDFYERSKYKGTVWSFILLADLGADGRDERMQDAIDLLRSKRDDQGRWINERPYSGRMQVTIEPEGQPSKWVTLHALKVLKWVKQMNIARH